MQTLSVKERLLRAMRGQEVDRIPNGPRVWSWLIEYLGGQSAEDYVRLSDEMPYDPLLAITGSTSDVIYADGDYSRLKDVSVSVTRERGPDFSVITRVFTTPAGQLQDRYKIGDPGSVYGTGSNPHRLEHLVKNRDDLARLRYLMPEPQPEDFGRAVQAQDAVGDRALVQSWPTRGLDHDFVDSIGIDNCMILYYEDRAFFDEALRFFNDHHLWALHLACHNSTPVIFGSWYNFSLSAGWSPKIYRDAFLPLLTEHVRMAHEHELLYHLYDDGKSTALLTDWAAAGVDCVSTLPPPPMGDVDLAEAKRLLGNRTCPVGNVDLLNVILLRRPDEIREVVRQTLQAGAPGGRFVLSTSDSIRNGTPVENVRAYMEAAREFGATYL